MFSLLRALVNNAYWRMLLRKATWSEAWGSLWRVRKDARARKHLLALSILVLAPVLCIVYLVWLVGTGAIYFVPFVVPVIWLIRRGHRRQDEASLSIAPAAEPIRRDLSVAELALIRSHFARLSFVYAVFVERAASEAFLKQNQVPEGHEVVSRRIQLELLKSRGAWECMAQADRDAMIDADGSWEWARINRIAISIEPLRLLRWILRVDFYLPLIGEQMHVDRKPARELVEEPEKVLNGTALATVPMMEDGRDSAQYYLMRCAAELISRGLEEASSEEIRKWAVNASAAIGGNQSEDLLLDGKLVSEASEQQLRWAMALSCTRADFLEWAVSVLDGTVKLGQEFAPVT